MDANTQTTLHFDEEIFIADLGADFFRASFDVYMPDLGDGRRGAPYISLGNNDTIYSLQPEDRGPHVYWDARGRFRSHTTEFAGGTRTIVSETPLDEWQHVQLDIDLVNDTYDIFWSAGDSALELVKTYVPFQADTDLTAIDRIQITTYPIDEVTAARERTMRTAR